MILDGVVDNIALWDGITEWNPGDQYILVDITNNPSADIGNTYDGINFN